MPYFTNTLKSKISYYIEVVTAVASKNIRVRYRNSLFGFLWSLLNPLMMLGIFVFIFSKVFTEINNYPLFVLCGLVFWNFFTTTSSQLINVILENGGILKSVAIPPIIFPLASLVSNLVHFLLALIPFFALMFFFGLTLSFKILLIIPILIIYAIFCFGFSLILATLNVYFRDISMFWMTIQPALFYATPVAYDTQSNLAHYMRFNPFYHFLNIVRDILYRDILPAPKSWLIVIALAVLSLSIGLLIYNKLKNNFISNF